MEVVAPAGVPPAPFALCPRFNLLAVGMAPSAAARGDAAESGASRVDVLRLLLPSGDHDPGKTLRVDCELQAPGLRRLAWSATPRNLDGDDDGDDDGDEEEDEVKDPTKRTPVERHLYPAGLLAGGFNDGAVRIWTPEAPLGCDLKKLYVPKKLKAVLKLDKHPETAQSQEAEITYATSQMYSAIKNMSLTCSEDKEPQLHNEEDEDWCLIEDDAESMGWELITQEKTVVDYHETTQMKLVTEIHDLSGPVLGLSFCELNPYWIATAAKSDRICIHDLHYPVHLSKKKHEFTEVGSGKMNCQITCLKWNKISPTILASSGDAGCTHIWDVRAAPKRQCLTAFSANDKMCSSDLEFSWNNSLHLAVSTESSPTIKIWDLRYLRNPMHAYAGGDSGAVSLSWNRLGQLLSSHTNGQINCYDVYKEKMVREMDLAHCDLGLTWTHSENVAATLSSTNGVKLCRIG